jgi:hypothetical protein
VTNCRIVVTYSNGMVFTCSAFKMGDTLLGTAGARRRSRAERPARSALHGPPHSPRLCLSAAHAAPGCCERPALRVCCVAPAGHCIYQTPSGGWATAVDVYCTVRADAACVAAHLPAPRRALHEGPACNCSRPTLLQLSSLPGAAGNTHCCCCCCCCCCCWALLQTSGRQQLRRGAHDIRHAHDHHAALDGL